MLIGEINVPESLLNSELRLGIIEKILDHILNSNYSLNKPSQSDIDGFKEKTIAELQKKYPNSGITYTK